MKNLLIYLNPDKHFSRENRVLIEIQIDNSLDLGWNIGDIVLVTNFNYEYRGVKAVVIAGENYFSPVRKSTKFYSLPGIFEKGIIEDGVLYWCHDLDAFQTEVITEEELELDGLDVGFPDTFWPGSRRWSGGSFFFKKEARDIFDSIKDYMEKEQVDEEIALMVLSENNTIPRERYKRVNITYNYTWLKMTYNYEKATKLLKVLHFHPLEVRDHVNINKLDLFMYGKNEMGLILMPERLIKIFNSHGVNKERKIK